MVSRAATLSIIVVLLSASTAAALDRLPVPGGTDALRRVTGLPDAVTDDMLLVEAARAWYGVRDPIANPSEAVRRLIEHLATSTEPQAPGPALPLTAAVWTTVLTLKNPQLLPRALVANRSAMLLYHGLMGMDDETLTWMASQRWLLRYVLDEAAPAFAFAAPAVRVRNGSVIVPGGDAARAAWESLLDQPAAMPQSFVRALMARNGGRLAWLYSVLAELDDERRQFAIGSDGRQLQALARIAVNSAPEWNVAERPFWRPSFDFSLVLHLANVSEQKRPKGSDEFWREVFGSADLERVRTKKGSPLASGALVGIIFQEPYGARERWDVFSLGQRLAGVERDSPESVLALRGARRHPALAAMLDRIGLRGPALHVALHRASARLATRDEVGGRGELGPWQGALALIERAAITGGFDARLAERFLGELAALPLEDPRAELAEWLMTSLIPSLAARPGAPPDPERLVLQTMSGALTPSGARRPEPFTWEDLEYTFAAPEAGWKRMEEARRAQTAPSLDLASLAWSVAHGADQEARRLAEQLLGHGTPRSLSAIGRRIEEALASRQADVVRRQAATAAVEVSAAVLPVLAYVPHLAVTDTPSLGAEVAVRHLFAAVDSGQMERRMSPWRIARGQATEGWHLEGSLLLLDVALAEWYLRRNGEPPSSAPVFDEPDVSSLSQVAVLARARGPAGMQLEEAARAVIEGRRAAAAAGSASALDTMMSSAGIDPWRRRGLRLAAGSQPDIAARLSPAEAWRIGGAPGHLIPRVGLDGCVCFGAAPPSAMIMEGRRSAGTIGASSADAQLRVVTFLQERKLPVVLFGDVVAGTLADVIQQASAARSDDHHAIAAVVAKLDDARLEEHLLALVADGTLSRPSELPD